MVTKSEGAEAQVYSKTEFKGQIAFKLADGLYTITPWAKERLDLYFNYTTLNLTDSSGDTVSMSSPAFDARNRFEIGFKISVNPAFRVENKLSAKVKESNADLTFTNGFGPSVAKFSFMPSLNLGYAYSMGFSWSFNSTLFLHMYPIMDQAKNDKGELTNDGKSILESLEFEGTYNIGFNILKPLDIKDYSLTIFVEEYTDNVFKGENYVSTVTYDGNKHKVSGSYGFDNKIGLSSSFYGVTLVGNSFIRIKGAIDDIDTNGSDVFAGLQVGGSVKVDKFSFGVTYTGMQQVWLGSAKNDSGLYEPRATKDTDLKYWNNLIEGYFSIKL